MAIKETIGDASHFYQWLKQSDSYSNNFSYEGALALQEYLEELSEDIGEDIEFDPIAWCCEFTEYKNIKEIKENYNDIKNLDDLRNHTQVIEFDGGLIIQDF